jgi:hypothetical protein
MLILMTVAGAFLGFQLPELVNAAGGGGLKVPTYVNLMCAFSGAVFFHWLAR